MAVASARRRAGAAYIDIRGSLPILIVPEIIGYKKVPTVVSIPDEAVATFVVEQGQGLKAVVFLCRDRHSGKYYFSTLEGKTANLDDELVVTYLAPLLASGGRAGNVSIPKKSVGATTTLFNIGTYAERGTVVVSSIKVKGDELREVSELIANYDVATALAKSMLPFITVDPSQYDWFELREYVSTAVKVGRNNLLRQSPEVLAGLVAAVFKMFGKPSESIGIGDDGELTVFGVPIRELSKIVDIPKTVKNTKLSTEALIETLGNYVVGRFISTFGKWLSSLFSRLFEVYNPVPVTPAEYEINKYQSDKVVAFIEKIIERPNLLDILLTHILFSLGAENFVLTDNTVRVFTDKADIGHKIIFEEVLRCSRADNSYVCGKEELIKAVEKQAEQSTGFMDSIWRVAGDLGSVLLARHALRYVRRATILSSTDIVIDEGMLKYLASLKPPDASAIMVLLTETYLLTEEEANTLLLLSGAYSQSITVHEILREGNRVVAKASIGNDPFVVLLKKQKKRDEKKKITVVVGGSRTIYLDDIYLLIGKVLGTLVKHNDRATYKHVVPISDRVVIETTDTIIDAVNEYVPEISEQYEDIFSRRYNLYDKEKIMKTDIKILADIIEALSPRKELKRIKERKLVDAVLSLLDSNDAGKVVRSIRKVYDDVVKWLSNSNDFVVERIKDAHDLAPSKNIPLKKQFVMGRPNNLRELVTAVVLDNFFRAYTGGEIAGIKDGNIYLCLRHVRERSVELVSFGLNDAGCEIVLGNSQNYMKCSLEKAPELVSWVMANYSDPLPEQTFIFEDIVNAIKILEGMDTESAKTIDKVVRAISDNKPTTISVDELIRTNWGVVERIILPEITDEEDTKLLETLTNVVQVLRALKSYLQKRKQK